MAHEMAKIKKGLHADPPATGQDASKPHEMRIASGGSQDNYVDFALKFLRTSPSRPLVLHTRPPKTTDEESASQSAKSTTSLHSCTLSAPKLVSVVEVIKRRYLSEHPESGKHRAEGIWQYTKSGLLALPPGEEPDLAKILEGKGKPKLTHHPWLEVTLSTIPLGLEKQAGVTCQHVLAKRRRKAKTINAAAEPKGKDVVTADLSSVGQKRKSIDSSQGTTNTIKRSAKRPNLAS